MKQKRIITIVLTYAVGLNLVFTSISGCQSKKVSPDRVQPKVEISDNSNTVDDQTAQMLKQATDRPRIIAKPVTETRRQTMALPKPLPPVEVKTAPTPPPAIEPITVQQNQKPILEPAALPEIPFEDITTEQPALVNTDLADKLVSVNFEQADIRAVIKTVSDITGINFIIDDKITGTVTVLSPTKLRLDELYHFLESILEVQGFAAVPTGDHVKIVARADASKKNLRIRIRSEEHTSELQSH